jgi:hypothetical protein
MADPIRGWASTPEHRARGLLALAGEAPPCAAVTRYTANSLGTGSFSFRPRLAVSRVNQRSSKLTSEERAERYERKKERARHRALEYRRQNIAVVRAKDRDRTRRRREQNPEAVREYYRKWRERQKETKHTLDGLLH